MNYTQKKKQKQNECKYKGRFSAFSFKKEILFFHFLLSFVYFKSIRCLNYDIKHSLLKQTNDIRIIIVKVDKIPLYLKKKYANKIYETKIVNKTQQKNLLFDFNANNYKCCIENLNKKQTKTIKRKNTFFKIKIFTKNYTAGSSKKEEKQNKTNTHNIIYL